MSFLGHNLLLSWQLMGNCKVKYLGQYRMALRINTNGHLLGTKNYFGPQNLAMLGFSQVVIRHYAMKSWLQASYFCMTKFCVHFIFSWTDTWTQLCMYSTMYQIKNLKRTKKKQQLKKAEKPHTVLFVPLPGRTCPEARAGGDCDLRACRKLEPGPAVLHLIHISSNSLGAELHEPNPPLFQETSQTGL